MQAGWAGGALIERDPDSRDHEVIGWLQGYLRLLSDRLPDYAKDVVTEEAQRLADMQLDDLRSYVAAKMDAARAELKAQHVAQREGGA